MAYFGLLHLKFWSGEIPHFKHHLQSIFTLVALFGKNLFGYNLNLPAVEFSICNHKLIYPFPFSESPLNTDVLL